MKVLLTGANGFVGSHILDRLRQDGMAVVLLLRPSSDTRFIVSHLDAVEVVRGDLANPGALAPVMAGVTHVIHCAGATKALHEEGLFAANRDGTTGLIHLVNEHADHIERVVHISSLAAGRSGRAEQPAHEDDSPEPLSAYGESKRAAEEVVCRHCRVDHMILRPAAVYGPRDREFLPLFAAAAKGWAPVFGGGRQELSLVFAPDLAAAVHAALTRSFSGGWIVNAAAAEVVTSRQLVLEVGKAAGRRGRLLPMPWAALRLVCGIQAGWARLVRRPTVLAHRKYRELSAPGWVADTTRLRSLLGDVCPTRLADGLERTWQWYREAGWL
ncbi:MAG: NAD(P)-dependent oxidoreductase [Verrucomicrobiales bacterium]|nr:NAD(P)-dependent oxidoreductase [Verrucomicrobiales bacterium]MCP5525708.1 NAD(P)-dependent oxidoreductase [Verrucomicrobiales bacterium]